MFGQTEEVAEQVIPERDVLKCEQWEIGDKIMEQQCSLSLSRSAVGWGPECAGRQGERGIYVQALPLLSLTVSGLCCTTLPSLN